VFAFVVAFAFVVVVVVAVVVDPEQRAAVRSTASKLVAKQY
jgi:hypothetical protein